MSERRQARRLAHATTPENALPPELAAGPCIEIWADRPCRLPATTAAWMRARNAWREAIHEWAERTGWAHERRPADNACGLARTSRPWSRTWLLKHGRADIVEYFEHGTGREPWPDWPIWTPMEGGPMDA